jgi:hypothetical protein
VAPAVVADARSDLRIETEQDEDRNITYLLKNNGSRLIEAKVEVVKDCTGNKRKPIIRTYWVGPGEAVKIGREWRETSCRRDYRVVEAKHHGASRGTRDAGHRPLR